MNDLSTIHPEIISDNLNGWFTGFLRSLLIRTNFVINVRNKLGWRGLKPTFRNGEGWTCRIKNSKGVYGICFKDAVNETNWKTGTFSLFYFPNKDEELATRFSLDAAIVCQQVDYLDLVREFLVYPDFAQLYEIGELSLSISSDNQAITYSLEALENKQTISTGACCEVSGEVNTIINPGELDQDLPAYDVAKPFYDVLASTLSYNLSESPAFLKQATYKYNNSEKNKKSVNYINLSLGYNKEWFKKNKDQIIIHNNTDIHTQCFWQDGSDIPKEYSNATFWNTQLQKSTRFEKSYFDAEERPQFIILTGFLGSGKTSFLKHLIEYHTANNRFVAVIQNEIGETGLDAKLLEDNYAVLEIDEGCVCCSLIGQLKKGIQQILSNHKPDVVVLETSGLANPLNLMAELDEIHDLIRFDSITTVVDAQNYKSSMQSSNIVVSQITSADIILLNKVDLLSENNISIINKKLQLLNPHARVIQSVGGDVNPALLYDIDKDSLSNPAVFNKLNYKHASTTNHMNEGLGSKKITFDKPLEKEVFFKKINEIPNSIYRIKGILKFTDSPEPYFFQWVYGQCELTPANSNDNYENFLIFIGETTSLNILNLIYF